MWLLAFGGDADLGSGRATKAANVPVADGSDRAKAFLGALHDTKHTGGSSLFTAMATTPREIEVSTATADKVATQPTSAALKGQAQIAMTIGSWYDLSCPPASPKMARRATAGPRPPGPATATDGRQQHS